MFAVPSFFGYNTTFVNGPVATAATGVGDTSFTANWNAFSGASYYLLDVSLSSSFSSFVLQDTVTTATSYVVTGLTASTTYYYRIRAAINVDSDVAGFVSRVYTAGGTLSYTEVTATETLVADLKGYGIWTAMKAVYPMVGGGTGSTAARQAACEQNLISASFTGTFTSGWTFASTGVTPNGVSAFMDTTLTPNGNLSQNDAHATLYSRTNNLSGTQIDLGCGNGGGSNQDFYLSAHYAGLGSISNINGQGFAGGGSNTTSLGFFLSQRIAVNTTNIYQNNTFIKLNSSTSSTPTSSPIYLGRNTATEYSVRELAFASFGASFDATQRGNLYTAVQAFQTTLNRYVDAPWYNNGNLLLDNYPSAAAAYSVRKLRNNYIGGPIRVRRSSDNAEQDIYFDANGNLDTAQLTSFCGAGNGFVTTWYDQSGNGLNAMQSTAANQPQIVSSGSVINVNGKASLQFDGSNDEFSLSSTITTSIYSNFVVLKKTSTTSIVIPSGLANGQLTGAWSDGNLYENNGSSFVYAPYSNDTNQNLFSVIKNGNTLSDFSATQNASTLGSYSGSPFTSITTDRLGARSSTFSEGNLQEIVLYSLDQSSNRTGIRTNINTYYGIY